TRPHGHVAKRSIAIVLRESMGVGAEMRFEDIEMSVVVVIANSQTHAALLTPVLVQRYPGLETALRERAVVIVAEEQAGRGVAGHVDVGPAVAVEIGCGDRQGIVGFDAENAGSLADIRECPIAIVVVETM